MKKLKLPRAKSLDIKESSPKDKVSAVEAMADSLPATPASSAPKIAPPVKTKPAKPDMPKVIRSWALIKGSLGDWRTDWLSYLKLLAIVALPINILPIFTIFQDPYSSSYISFAAIVMNVTLIWAIVQRQETGQFSGIKRSYYDSSVALVRFVLTSFLLVIMLIPAAFGLTLYALGAADPTGITGVESLLVGFVSFILAVPSIYLITRYALAPLAAIRDGLAPIAALRRSRQLVKGYFWPVLGRMLMLGLLLVAVSLPTTLVVVGLSFAQVSSDITKAFFQIVATFTALPIANLFLLRLFASLEASKAAREAAE